MGRRRRRRCTPTLSSATRSGSTGCQSLRLISRLAMTPAPWPVSAPSSPPPTLSCCRCMEHARTVARPPPPKSWPESTRAHAARTRPRTGVCTHRYRAIYLVHINSGLARPVMTLYMITRESSAKKAGIAMDVRAPFLLNMVDNLLVVHSLGSKVRWGRGLASGLQGSCGADGSWRAPARWAWACSTPAHCPRCRCSMTFAPPSTPPRLRRPCQWQRARWYCPRLQRLWPSHVRACAAHCHGVGMWGRDDPFWASQRADARGRQGRRRHARRPAAADAPDWISLSNDLIVSKQLGVVWTVQLALSALMTGYTDRVCRARVGRAGLRAWGGCGQCPDVTRS